MGMILWLFAIFLIGVPICFSLGFVSLGGVLLNGFPPLVVVQRMFTGADSIALIAIPLFMLAGELMFQGGMSKRMVDFADTLLGHFPSGLHVLCGDYRIGHCRHCRHRRHHDPTDEGEGL